MPVGGSRHQEARKRRELMEQKKLIERMTSDRQLASPRPRGSKALKANEPPSCCVDSSTGSSNFSRLLSPRSYTKEDIESGRNRCIERVRRMKSEAKEQERLLEQRALEITQRNAEIGAQASTEANTRLKLNKQRQINELECDIETLIQMQSSSVESINIARMISPRLEQKAHFRRNILRNSKEEARIDALLRADRIGTFYR